MLYRQEGRPVAVAGLYKCISKPDLIYMGLFGVIPEHSKSQTKSENTLSAEVLEKCKHFARENGARFLGAITEDGEGYIAAQKFYERHGFTNAGSFNRNNEIDREYLLRL